jgi:hypothetical protein
MSWNKQDQLRAARAVLNHLIGRMVDPSTLISPEWAAERIPHYQKQIEELEKELGQ